MPLIDLKSKQFRHTQWHWHEADFDLQPESIVMPILDKLPNGILSHPVLSKENEWQLFRRLNFVKYRLFMDDISYHGDMVVRIQNEIIQRNLKFVATLVGEKKLQIADRFDLFQDAAIWMLDCVHAFNYKKGLRFYNYYAHAFHNNFCGWLKKRDTIEKPFSVLENIGEDQFDVLDEKSGDDFQNLEISELVKNVKKEIKVILDLDFVFGTILLLRFGLLDSKCWTYNEISLVVKTSPQAVQKRVVNWLKQRKKNGD